MNWNVFTRKSAIWVVLIVVFFVSVLLYVLVGMAFSNICGGWSERTTRLWNVCTVFGSLGNCTALSPFLKKRFVGSKYPLKRATIRPKDLSIGDIITFPDRECVFEGLYHGEYLFAPKGELKGEGDYIKLCKKQIPASVRKVVSPEYGLKWVSPDEVCIDDSTHKLVEEK